MSSPRQAQIPRWSRIIAFLQLLFLACATLPAQQEPFTAVNPPLLTIPMDAMADKDIVLHPFPSDTPIGGLTVSGDVMLHSDSALIRVVLVDSRYNEYLVFEGYTLFLGSREASIVERAEETSLLDGVIPMELRVEITDARFYLRELQLLKTGEVTKQAKGELRSAREQARIDRINQHLKARNIPWVAGETSFSRLSYEERKASFGGRLPNLNGFEYYTGGVFVMPGSMDSPENSEGMDAAEEEGTSPYVEEFDWRDRHGKNWISPVKNQLGCGSCWAFGATGATEHLVNIYFNRVLNLDLSEQYLLSCSGTGSCNGGWTYQTVDFIRSTGIIEESCFPYSASDEACGNSCPDPQERILIKGYQNHNPADVDNYKKIVLSGASTFSIIPWRHSITLVGYKTLRQGDRVLIKTSSQSTWVTIDPQSSLIGKTAWILKNSWGTYWGDGGFAYVVTGANDINPWHTCRLFGPVTSQNYFSTDIACSDEDGDGYYCWGIGPKPSHCPPCPDEPDGDDSDPCLGPMDEYGHITALVAPKPVAEDVTVFEGQPVPDLHAEGQNITWYADYVLSEVVHKGNSFATGHTERGTYMYYVTQTIGECESPVEGVMLSILEGISPPLITHAEVCQGIQGLLEAEGENVRWYRDAELTDLLHTGNVYLPDIEWLGTHTYYATQTRGGIESPAAPATYTVKAAPKPVFVEDRSYCMDEDLFMFAKGDSIRWYKSGFIDELRDPRDGKTYKVVTLGTQVWMAENLAVGEPIPGTEEQADNGVIEKYVYNNDPEEGEAFGGLYQWDELMAYTTEAGGQGICPAGWHVPSHEEWSQLEIFLGMSEIDTDVMGFRSGDVAAKLIQGGGSGFEALYAGKRHVNGYFENQGMYTTYWTSDGYTRTLADSYDRLWASKGDNPTYGFSVRCVMDDSAVVRFGNRLDISGYTPGDYTFVVTNTENECESSPDTARLVLRQTPDPPVVPDAEACIGEGIPALSATGENITWYGELPLEPLTDVRDGRTYDVVAIGKQVWMAENLAVGQQVGGEMEQSDNGIIEKYCYNDDAELGDQYGGLYQWNELMGYTAMEITRGICPDGWRVPSHRDWMEMEIELGMGQAEATLYEWRGTDQGTRLKLGGSSGFNALLGGKRTPDGSFKSLPDYGTYWNSTGYTRTFKSGFEGEMVYCSRFDDLAHGFSVRCIMEDSAYTSHGNRKELTGFAPGVYQFDVTQSVEGCESDATTATITIHPGADPPVAANVTVCEGAEVPALEASGTRVRWYAEDRPDSLVHTGNLFQPGHHQPGEYTYHVTQQPFHCESAPVSATLQIMALPESPVVADLEVCEGVELPQWVATGTGICWFSDSSLLDTVCTDPVFDPGLADPGHYSYYVAQTVGGCISPAAQADLVIHPLPPAPATADRSICDGDSVWLEAKGNQVNWYLDSACIQHLCSGGHLVPADNEPGIHVYYATDSSLYCESSPSRVRLQIREVPGIPDVLGTDACEGDPGATLEASGDSIRWYADPEKTLLVHSGNIFLPEELEPGEYLYYASQTTNGCEGPLAEAGLLIRSLPRVSLGRDTLIGWDQTLILGPFPSEYRYLWFNGSSEPYLIVDGEEYGEGDHLIWVEADHQGCDVTDSVTVTVENTTRTNKSLSYRGFRAYPNPAGESVTIASDRAIGGDILVEVYRGNGVLARQYTFADLKPQSGNRFRIELEKPGIYHVRIHESGEVWTLTVIRK